jgi:ATP-dependent Clp protease ATP-binding subunit ClpB
VVSFKNAIIILTSNLGSSMIIDAANKIEARDMVMASVRSHFRPEFINRIDEFIIFDPLEQDQIKSIVRLQAKRVAQRLEDKKMRLVLSEAAVDYLARVGYDPVYGARPVKRAVQRELETGLAKAMLRGDFEEEDTVEVDVGESGLVYRKGPKVTSPVDGSYAYARSR